MVFVLFKGFTPTGFKCYIRRFCLPGFFAFLVFTGTTLSVAQLASHNHGMGTHFDSSSTRQVQADDHMPIRADVITTNTGSNATHTHTVNINHNHTVTNPAHGHTATSTNVNAVPPYYKLVYCVKVK